MKNPKPPRRTVEKSERHPPPRRPATAVAIEDRDPPAKGAGLQWWHVALGLLLSLFLVFEVYGPALNGQFVFDDSYLPFLVPGVQDAPLHAWLGVRPLLMASYWWNYQSYGLNPYPYHAVNLLFHAANAVLAWAVVRRYLKLAGESGTLPEILAAFGGVLFLVHPVQTESVAYVASRSEAMSIFFVLLALTVFLYRKSDEIGWARSALVLVLFLAALTVKEHTIALLPLLLLTDFYFNTPFSLRGVVRNWRLYLPLLIAGLLGVVAVLRVLSSSLTAGFVIKEFTWYQYLFTQFRVIWLYVRLFFLPVGLNADYDLTASKNILDQGAVLGLVGLLIAAAVAWRYRREFPLASFGFFGMLLLLAPTSSVVPIRDVAVERRLYLPFVCLVLIALDLLRRWKVSRPVLAGLLAALTAGAAVATHQRSQVWSNSLALWEDTLAKSPHNTRALFQLAHAQWESGQCDKAATTYERVSASGKYPDDIPINWSLALECAGKPDDAVAKLQQAAARKPSAHIFATIGMVRAKQGRPGEALDALATAEKLDPAFDMTYVYRGNVYLSQNNIAGAESEFNRALSINGSNQPAREALVRLRRIPR